LRHARQIVARYRFVLEPDDELGFIAHGLELPNVLADGKTPDACVKAAREAMTAVVATLIERGESPPKPASPKNDRTAQVNIRLSALEKLDLENRADQGGFRGISDYVRAVVLRDGRKT